MYKVDLKALEGLLAKREGKVMQVYADHLGKLTAGIGHLLTGTELKSLKLGDAVTEKQVSDWFAKDCQKAVKKAEEQAEELGIHHSWFMVVLASANFQLGDFKAVFTGSYPLLKAGDFRGAIAGIQASKWMKQTPVRATDMIDAIRML